MLSLLVLLCGLLSYFLIQMLGYNTLTLFSYISLLNLLICAIFANGSRIIRMFFGPNQPTASSAADDSGAGSSGSGASGDESLALLKRESVDPYIPHFIGFVNGCYAFLVTTLQCRSNIRTVLLLLFFALLSLISSLFDLPELLLICFIGAFSLPKIYHSNRTKLEPMIKRLHIKFIASLHLLVEKNVNTAIPNKKKNE